MLASKEKNQHEIFELNIMQYQLFASNNLLFDGYGNSIKGFVFTREEILAVWEPSKLKSLFLRFGASGDKESAQLELNLSSVKSFDTPQETNSVVAQGKITLPISVKENSLIDSKDNPVEGHNLLVDAIENEIDVFSTEQESKLEGIYFTHDQLKALNINQELDVLNKYDNFVFIPVLNKSPHEKYDKKVNFSLAQIKDGIITSSYVAKGVYSLHEQNLVSSN